MYRLLLQSILLLGEVISRESFELVDFWLKDVREKVGENVFFVLVGNKKDLKDERIVSEEQGALKMQELGLNLFFESSAKTSEAIQEVFNAILEEVQLVGQIQVQKKSFSKEK